MEAWAHFLVMSWREQGPSYRHSEWWADERFGGVGGKLSKFILLNHPSLYRSPPSASSAPTRVTVVQLIIPGIISPC